MCNHKEDEGYEVYEMQCEGIFSEHSQLQHRHKEGPKEYCHIQAQDEPDQGIVKCFEGG